VKIDKLIDAKLELIQKIHPKSDCSVCESEDSKSPCSKLTELKRTNYRTLERILSLWKEGSRVQIYSRSNGVWFDGKITRIAIDDNKDEYADVEFEINGKNNWKTVELSEIDEVIRPRASEKATGEDTTGAALEDTTPAQSAEDPQPAPHQQIFIKLRV